MKKALFLFLIPIILSSCATHIGIMSGNASISDANFNVAGLAIGTAKTQHILGFGGLGKDALILEAKRNLYTNYPLKKGQALANVTVDIKRSFFPFVMNTKAIISADVIDFNSEPSDSSFAHFNKTIDYKLEESPFEPNQQIVYKGENNVIPARVIESGPKKSTLLIETKSGRFKLKRINNAKLFANENNANTNYKVGDGVKFWYNDTIYGGIVKAINKETLVVDVYFSKEDKRLMNIKIKNIVE